MEILKLIILYIFVTLRSQLMLGNIIHCIIMLFEMERWQTIFCNEPYKQYKRYFQDLGINEIFKLTLEI